MKKGVNNMKKNIVLTLILVILFAWMAVPAFAAEDYSDGDVEQVYTWVREGDAVFCYINNGGWSEADMLKGFHTINGEVYYFCEEPIGSFQYGQMYVGELWWGDMTLTFDEEGCLVSYYQGPERE